MIASLGILVPVEDDRFRAVASFRTPSFVRPAMALRRRSKWRTCRKPSRDLSRVASVS